MPKITVTGSEYADITACFLMDKLTNPDEVIEYDVNERFNALVEVLARRGMKAPLLQTWLDMDPQTRVKYRQIKQVFRDGAQGKVTYIEIHKDKRSEIIKPGVFQRIKNIVKKIITLGLAKGD